MKPRINNKETNDKDDWRFRGQDEYLLNVRLVFSQYKRHSEPWDHDHCEFCGIKFSEHEGDLHKGYSTLDQKWWICEECFKDFKDNFGWLVINETEIDAMF